MSPNTSALRRGAGRARWPEAFAPVTLVTAVVGVAALVLSGLVVANPAAAAAAVGLAAAAVLLTRPTGRLIGFVVGGLLVFGRPTGLDAPKFAYLAFVALSALVAGSRAGRLTRTSWGRPARQLLRGSALFTAFIALSSVVAVAHDTTVSNWLRDVSGYVLLAAAPVIALDAASTLRHRTALLLVRWVGVVAAVGFATDWLARRGISSLPIGRLVLASLPLCAVCFGIALVRAFTGPRRAGWTVVAFGIPACLLVTGTRTSAVLVVGLLGIVGARRKFRVPVGQALAGLGVVVVAMLWVLPRLGAVVSTQGDFLAGRLDSGVAFLAGQTDASAVERVRSYGSVLAQFTSSPVFGTGPGHLYPPVDPSSPPVLTLDTPLLVLAKFGLVGTAVFVVFLAGLVVAFHSSRVTSGWSPTSTEGRVVALLLGALLPFGALYEDKGLAIAFALLLLDLFSGDRDRAVPVSVAVGRPDLFPPVTGGPPSTAGSPPPARGTGHPPPQPTSPASCSVRDRTGTGRGSRSALIVNAYSFRNAGDAAIMLSTLRLLSESGFDRVVISTRYTEDSHQYARWGIDVVGPLVPFATTSHGGRGRAVRLALDTARALVPAVLAPVARRPRLRRAARRIAPAATAVVAFDLVVVAGGGYLYTSRRTVNLSLVHSCLTMLVARRLAGSVVSMPQSIGPLNRRLDAVAVRLAFGGLTAHVREQLSLTVSRRPPRLRRVVLVPDVVFLGVPPPHPLQGDRLPLAPDGPVIPADAPPVARVVVMTWSWSTSVDATAQDRYLQAIAELCDLLHARGYRVVLGGHSSVPEHGQDDIEVCRSVAARAVTTHGVDADCNVAHLEEAYRSSAVVIGTRLHACIMAIACGTPAVALAYQEKALGVAAGLDGALPVFRVDDFDPAAVVRAVESSSPAVTAAAASRAASLVRAVYGPLLGAP